MAAKHLWATVGIAILIGAAAVWKEVPLKARGASPEYTVTDLGAWNPSAINSAGDIVGFSSGAPWHALFWSQGVLTDLGTMGGSGALALGINDSGQIAGVLNGSSGFEHFILTNGTVTHLGVNAGYYYNTRINSAGDVAGVVAGPQTFWYSHLDGVHYLTAPGCGGSWSADINDSGLVVGNGEACSAGSYPGFVWRNGTPQMLPNPPGYLAAQPYGMNAGGQVVGAIAWPLRPILWQPDGAGGYTATILPLPLGVTDSGAFAKDINDLGVIVGWAQDPYRAVIWDSTTSVRDLNTLIPSDSGVLLEGTEAINNSGQILAYGGGHGYLLTPVSSGDTTPPILTAPALLTVEATSPAGAVVTFDVTASDPDDAAGPVTCDPISGSVFPLGTTTVNCTSTDTHGNTGSGSFTVTVQDTTPPTIASVVPSQAQLWPPNNKMVLISLSVSATDLVTPTPSCQIASVSSNEPGAGQWQTTGPLTLNLLASRNGKGSGRIYTISVQCSDAAGNTASRSTTVAVPHDQGK